MSSQSEEGKIVMLFTSASAVTVAVLFRLPKIAEADSESMLLEGCKSWFYFYSHA
jgi:hypothetical protein